MKLPQANRGRTLSARLKLASAELVGHAPLDSTRLALYRGELFAEPLNAYLQTVLRGASEWSIGERELFAAFVSHKNGCTYCYRTHRAVAERALAARTVEAVFDDYRSAPVSRQVRATLGFLKQLTEQASRLGLGDVSAVLGAGVSREALDSAIHVCVAVTALNRVADALGFELPDATALARAADHHLKNGYA